MPPNVGVAIGLVMSMPEPLEKIANDPARSLTEIDGVGKDLAEKIVELVTTRKLTMLEELQAQVPPGVMALMRIPGLGPEKAAVPQGNRIMFGPKF